MTGRAFSTGLIDRSGYELEGFAEGYDRFRPAPPQRLLALLGMVARLQPAELVVDLGAGTGLSTRLWADHAKEVVGIEPSPAMVEVARRVTHEPNVRFVAGYADHTGLLDASAAIVTCAQAFHWMQPGPVLAEAARILRPGGVFAAYDYDVPPVVLPELDEIFARHFRSRGEARQRLGLQAGASTWPKEQHLERILQSGHFRFARELVFHAVDETDAPRLLGLAETLGGPRAIFTDRAPEVTRTFEQLRAAATRLLGDQTFPIVLSYRIRLGIK